MATTVSTVSLDCIKGAYSGSPVAAPFHLWRVSAIVSGTYNQASRPQIDVAAAFAALRRNLTGCNVLWAICYGDYYDGASALTVPNGAISFSSTGTSTNNVIVCPLYSGATNGGTGGTELANGTSVSGAVGLLFGCTLTGAGALQ